MAKPISKEELDRLKGEGATVRRAIKQPARKTVKASEPEPEPKVQEDDKLLTLMAATLANGQAWQEDMGDQLLAEMRKANARTKAKVTVTKRNEAGSIESAVIEIIG